MGVAFSFRSQSTSMSWQLKVMLFAALSVIVTSAAIPSPSETELGSHDTRQVDEHFLRVRHRTLAPLDIVLADGHRGSLEHLRILRRRVVVGEVRIDREVVVCRDRRHLPRSE